MNRAEKLARSMITDDGLLAIGEAIKSFENRTSGEIVLSFNTSSHGQPYKQAKRIFTSNKLHETRERNAILIALFLKDRTFAIFGDEGIHAKVSEDYWSTTVEKMSEHFKSGQLGQGLVWAIQELGERLVEFFPSREDDINELSDDLHFGDS